MTLSELKLKVRAILNESGEDESFTLISVDTVKLDDYIASVISDAISFVLNQKIPRVYLPIGSVSSVTSSEDGCSIVSVPTDYVRFDACRLSGWKREVQELGGELEYKINHNPITRAGVNKPACVMANNASGKVIECFPSGTLVYFRYIKGVGALQDTDQIPLNDRIMPSVCYAAAYLVYSIFENQTSSERMKAISIELLPNE